MKDKKSKKSSFEPQLAPQEVIVYRDTDSGYIVTELPLDEQISSFTVYDEYWNYIDEYEDMRFTKEDGSHSVDFANSEQFENYIECVDFYEHQLADDDWWDSRWNGYYNVDNYNYGKLPAPKPKTPEEIEAEKKAERELLESLCKSDTIVFHMEDSSTDMLFNVYQGKGWDVYRGSGWDVSDDFIRELIERHDKIICLGHGSPSGLIGGTITKTEVPYLKQKKVFALWCYAATFFRNNGFEGQGILCSDNAPSEVWECKAACDANVSAEWIKENITYWSACIEKYLELAWTDPEEACRRAQEDYFKSYEQCTTDDERDVVNFLTNTIQVV